MTVSVLQTGFRSNTAAATTCVATLAGATTPGSTIEAIVQINSTPLINGFTDSEGNVFTAKDEIVATGPSRRYKKFVATNIRGSAAGAYSATATYQFATTSGAVWLFEIGGASVNAGDVVTAANQQTAPTTATDAVTTTAATNASQPAMMLALCIEQPNYTHIPAVGTGFTSLFSGGDTIVGGYRAETKSITSTTAQAATFTVATNELCVSFLSIYQEAIAQTNVTSVGAITDGSSFTISGTGFSASGNSVTIGGVAQTITAQSTTSITCTAVLGSLFYGTQYPIQVINAVGGRDPTPSQVTIAPSAAYKYVTLIDPLVPSSQRLHAASGAPDIVGGMQVRISNVTAGFTLADVAIYSDGEWIATNGSYSFDASANDGSGWSAPATQTLGTAPPVITADPANITVLQGATATFSVFASGTITGYQWFKNGASISGATSQSYTTPTTIPGDNGAQFYCQVSNASGYAQSAAAVLTVVSTTTLPLRNDVWNGSLPGLSINRSRAYVWKTAIQESLSGKESRVKLGQYPRVYFTLQYELLRNALTVSELKAIVGLFNAAGGSYDTFLYQDPDFNHVALEKIGTGDAATTKFQLTASFQNTGSVGAPELVQNLNGIPVIIVNGAAISTSLYTISPVGVITFNTAPAAGADIRWTGDFYYRVRFSDDTLEMTQFMDTWWQSRAIILKSIKL